MFNENEVDIKQFVIELRMMGLQYDEETKLHHVGSKNLGSKESLITNEDMKTMCSHFFGRDYDYLQRNEQRKLRERIFRQLRGEQ